MRAALLLVLLMLATSASGCTMMGSRKEQVSATDNQFTPNALTVKQNVEVGWNNEGNNLHSVTIHKGGDPLTTTKKDTDIPKGAATTFKFEETGTFHVYCKYHSRGTTGTFTEGMVMTVMVEA